MSKEELKTRVLQNPTHLICSVKNQKEVSGPLGGISVEYIIEFNTSRSEFKTNFQSESAVVNFTISKTFREIEYLYNKLKNHHSSIKFPDYFTKDNRLISSNEQRRNVIDNALEFIASHSTLVESSVLLDFIDFKPSKISVDAKSTISKKPITTSDLKVEAKLEEKVDSKTSASAQKASSNKQPENLFGTDSGEEDDDEDLFKQIKFGSNSEPVKASEVRTSTIYSDEHLLFGRQDLGGAVRNHEKNLFFLVHNESQEDQQDSAKTTLDLEAAAELLQVDDSLSDILEEMHMKPSKPATKSKPEVKPKPNLNLVKDKDKPTVPPRPSSLFPNRPVPPPRSTVDKNRESLRNRSTLTSNGSKLSSPTGEAASVKTDAIDILEYISKAESALNENVDLF
ncbi:hypothetical protein CHUAL_002447 [Chamberlinius hualienensis]